MVGGGREGNRTDTAEDRDSCSSYTPRIFFASCPS
eukprot:SAG25_NODE_1896_length_2182_cov_1.104177_1_plen_34_part_10